MPEGFQVEGRCESPFLDSERAREATAAHAEVSRAHLVATKAIPESWDNKDKVLEKLREHPKETKEITDFLDKAAVTPSWAPGPDVIDVLKKAVFRYKEPQEFRAEFLQRSAEVSVTRYWDRTMAYVDVISLSMNATPDFKQWPLGDGFERCFLAHKAVATNSYDHRVPWFHYIHHLEVRPEFQKKSLGTGLLRFLLTELRIMERDPWIWLCARGSNLYQFYERFGFRRLQADVALMYWDRRYTEHIKLDPQQAAKEVPYVSR